MRLAGREPKEVESALVHRCDSPLHGLRRPLGSTGVLVVWAHQPDREPGVLWGIGVAAFGFATGELVAVLYGLVTLLPALGVEIRRTTQTDRAGGS
jgi:hypothetical protein